MKTRFQTTSLLCLQRVYTYLRGGELLALCLQRVYMYLRGGELLALCVQRLQLLGVEQSLAIFVLYFLGQGLPVNTVTTVNAVTMADCSNRRGARRTGDNCQVYLWDNLCGGYDSALLQNVTWLFFPKLCTAPNANSETSTTVTLQCSTGKHSILL